MHLYNEAEVHDHTLSKCIKLIKIKQQQQQF